MKHSETSWQSADGAPLFAQSWAPETPAKAAVCLVHGLGEHSGRYTHVAQAFTHAGYGLLAFDLRGHGKTQGPRGHVGHENAFLEDLDCLIEQAAGRYPGLPLFLYGHSLGGLLALFYSLRRKPRLTGVIATSPALLTPLGEQKAKVALSKAMGSVLPGVTIATGLDANQISRDPEVVRVYKADPLVHGKASFALATSMIRMIEYTRAHAAEFPLPLLLVHGGADEITYAQGSQEFAAQVRTPVTLKIWPGLKHETHNEPEQAQTIAYLVAWMDACLD